MPTKQRMMSSTSAVPKRLNDLHDKLGCWQSVAANLGLHYGLHTFDRAYLCRVAAGKQKPSKALVIAMDEYRRATRPVKPAPPEWVSVAADWLAARAQPAARRVYGRQGRRVER